MNPYQPPKSNLEFAPSAECYRIKDKVFVPQGHDLPPRCVKCNQPAVQPIKKRNFQWHTAWLYLIILLNILLYAIIALMVRRRVTLSPGLCQEHATKRRNRILIFTIPGLLMVVGGVVVAIWMDSGEPFAITLLGVLTLFGALIAQRIVWPTEIDKTGTHLAGCGEPFLNSLRENRPD